MPSMPNIYLPESRSQSAGLGCLQWCRTSYGLPLFLDRQQKVYWIHLQVMAWRPRARDRRGEAKRRRPWERVRTARCDAMRPWLLPVTLASNGLAPLQWQSQDCVILLFSVFAACEAAMEANIVVTCSCTTCSSSRRRSAEAASTATIMALAIKHEHKRSLFSRPKQGPRRSQTCRQSLWLESYVLFWPLTEAHRVRNG